jgi:RNA polymerase sigma-70 factor (ECF subfamily)
MAVSRAEQEDAVQRFLDALQSGDVQRLLAVLAPDVVLVSDGGGIVQALRRPVAGAGKVARLLSGLATVAPEARLASVVLNGAPAVRIDFQEAADTAVSLTVEDGRITRIYAVRNPHKLARLDTETSLTR